jgi:hypothetical protein
MSVSSASKPIQTNPSNLIVKCSVKAGPPLIVRRDD